jgi:hypothetical protein
MALRVFRARSKRANSQERAAVMGHQAKSEHRQEFPAAVSNKVVERE